MRKKPAFFILLILNIGFVTANSQSKIVRSSNKVNEAATTLVFIEDISINASYHAAPAIISSSAKTKAANISYPFVENKTYNSAATIEKAGRFQVKYAILLDVNIESIKNQGLFKFIEDWYGTNYRYGGTTKSGVDCSAFAASLLQAVYGFNVPRMAKEQYKISERIKKENLQEGDLVFFNTTGGISHVGVYIANDYFVHSSVSQGVIISTLNDPYFNKKYLGGGRVSGNAIH